MMGRRYECVFLDRDGTINIDPGYISNVKDFKFYDYTFNALSILAKITNFFIIITNQSGVSRGIIKEKDLIEINCFIKRQFLKNKINLLNIFYCTDLPEASTIYRKPGVGMFLRASREYNLNLSKCIMIGDSCKDIIPANKLGMESMLITNGENHFKNKKNNQCCKPKYVSKNLIYGAKELSN